MFDWLDFLTRRGVAYDLAGRDEIRIACPLCGGGHQSMAVNLAGLGWHCWRNREHRGKSPVRLLVALGLSPAEARDLIGARYSPPNDLAARVTQLLAPNSTGARPIEPRLPPEFRAISLRPPAKPFAAYLRGRGFRRRDIAHLSARFGLRYARFGPWRYRIIFTVEFERRLVAWTGRTIGAGEPRYLASGDEDGADSPTNYLLWFDELLKPKASTLVLTEGPFDALKLRVLGQPATCFFTARPGPAQIDLLRELLPRWERRVLLLDAGTLPMALAVQSDLAGLAVEVKTLPPGIKDAGELTSLDALWKTNH